MTADCQHLWVLAPGGSELVCRHCPARREILTPQELREYGQDRCADGLHDWDEHGRCQAGCGARITGEWEPLRGVVAGSMEVTGIATPEMAAVLASAPLRDVGDPPLDGSEPYPVGAHLVASLRMTGDPGWARIGTATYVVLDAPTPEHPEHPYTLVRRPGGHTFRATRHMLDTTYRRIT